MQVWNTDIQGLTEHRFCNRPVAPHEALGGSIYFPGSLNELLPQSHPSVEKALRSNHSSDVLSVLDNFHFAKFLTVCRQPIQLLLVATVAAILYPTTLPMTEVEPSQPVHHHQGWRQSGHQQPKGRSRHRKIIGVCTRFVGRIESWSHRKMGRTPLQIGSHSLGSVA